MSAFQTRLSGLKLTNFRNYAKLDLTLAPQSAVLVGANGSGKTNLLEAISFLSPGRGLRRTQYADVARAPEKGGNGQWAVSATVMTEFDETEIGTGLSGGDEASDRARKIRIDREPVKSADTLLDYIRVLWLTPAMDGLFTGPAGDRRRFLDRLVLAIDATHGTRVNAFDKAVRNRNKILDEAFSNDGWLDAAETQVAELGVAIAAARQELVSLLAQAVDHSRKNHEHFPNALLALEGSVDEMVQTLSATDAEDAYKAHLKDTRLRDKHAGRTLDGPHRSDLIVHHGPKAMPAKLCSTGEQKALLIGIVLAHAHLVSGLSGMTPVLLLDEIAAHLDTERRIGLFDVIESLKCQAFMTGTDRTLFDHLGDRAQVLEVNEGTVEPVTGPAPA